MLQHAIGHVKHMLGGAAIIDQPDSAPSSVIGHGQLVEIMQDLGALEIREMSIVVASAGKPSLLHQKVSV